MKILFFSYFGFNPKNGGVERVSNLLAKEFIRRGHNVFFITKQPGEADSSYEPLVEEIFLPHTNKIYTKKSSEFFVEYVKKRNIDVIICQHSEWDNISPYLAKQNTKAKLLYALHLNPYAYSLKIEDTTLPVFSLDRSPLKLCKWLMRVVFKKQKQERKNRKMGKLLTRLSNMGDGLVFLAPQYINSALSISDTLDSKKLFAIGNPNTYAEEDIVELPKENTLLFVGRLSREKKPEKALLLWKRLQRRFPAWNLKIVGGGDLKKPLEKLKEKLQLERCSIEGRQDPAPYYSKAKILLLTSDFEGFPMVIMEAMQHGVVPVAFNSFESLENIIEDGVTGLAVKPYDLDEFENKLAFLMENEEKLATMAEEAKLSVRKFNVSVITDQWFQLFRKIGLNL